MMMRFSIKIRQDGKLVLASLKRVMDAILVQAATEINFSSFHQYYFKEAYEVKTTPSSETTFYRENTAILTWTALLALTIIATKF
jgi:hypothetical protein